MSPIPHYYETPATDAPAATGQRRTVQRHATSPLHGSGQRGDSRSYPEDAARAAYQLTCINIYTC